MMPRLDTPAPAISLEEHVLGDIVGHGAVLYEQKGVVPHRLSVFRHELIQGMRVQARQMPPMFIGQWSHLNL